MAEGGEVTAERTESASKTKTMTITGTQAQEGPLVLKLRKPKSDKKVQWQEGVIDNEFMGKKSSKCCCIYSKPHRFGESDSESGDDSGDDDCCHEHRVARKKGAPPTANRPSQPPSEASN